MDAKRVVRTVEQIFILFFLSFFHIVLYYMLCSFCFARAVVIVCVRVDWRATVNALFLLPFASANDEHATDICTLYNRDVVDSRHHQMLSQCAHKMNSRKQRQQQQQQTKLLCYY